MMDWEEAMAEAKEEHGYGENDWIPREEWDSVVESAEWYQEEAYQEDLEDMRMVGRTKHKAYLESDWWAQLRRKIMIKFNGVCQDCSGTAYEVHHTTYANVGNEKEEKDLIPLCGECHRKRHGIK
jgi:hypothetical protein